MAFTPLILAGGKSTRMKSPKHLLPMPDGRPLYQHLLAQLQEACPDAPTTYISLAPDSDLDDFLRAQPTATAPQPRSANPNNVSTSPAVTSLPSPPASSPNPVSASTSASVSASPPTNTLDSELPKVAIILDHPPNSTTTTTNVPPRTQSSGPATGLLAAHLIFPTSTFLVVACDHPFLTAPLLRHLCEQYTPPVTCFRNTDGFAEPLVAVWGPKALGGLKERVEEAEKEGKGRGVGPARVVREVWGLVLDLGDVGGVGDNGGMVVGRELGGVNTPEEWEAAMRVMKGRRRGSE